MMRLEGIRKSFDGRTVLNGLTLQFPERGLCCILGRSGSGKTTLLRLLAGLDEPDEGSIEGKSSRISMVFQEDRLFEHATVLENVAVVSDRTRAAQILKELGLGQNLQMRPNQLSGGMRRRVSIARALAAPAELYLMDEPLKGLDEETREDAFGVIRRHTRNALLIMVTHEPEDAAGADLVVELEGPFL